MPPISLRTLFASGKPLTLITDSFATSALNSELVSTFIVERYLISPRSLAFSSSMFRLDNSLMVWRVFSSTHRPNASFRGRCLITSPRTLFILSRSDTANGSPALSFDSIILALVKMKSSIALIMATRSPL